MSLPKRLWADMAWPDFREAANWIAVLPVAAIEQHGPHLPLSTDAEIMQGYRARVFATLPKNLPVTFLPLQTIGLSPEHRDFPGTLTLSPETALKFWIELGDSVARTGVRKLVFLSSHGGNNGLLEVVARELRAKHTMLAVVASFARFGYPQGVFSSDEVTHGIHGGEIETSLMLAFKPDLVRTDKLVHFKAETIRMEKEFKHLRASKPAGFGWLTQDLHPNGAMGNAKTANAEKGHAAAEHGAKAFVELLQDVAAFPLERLKRSARLSMKSAKDIIRLLGMKPHPEGGHFVETYRDPKVSAGRAVSTAIYFLLRRGERSHWHKVDAAETWHYYAGDPLQLRLSRYGQGTDLRVLGPNLLTGERPQLVVPAGVWQAAESLGDWTLVGCTVAPGFRFEGFELAPKGWEPD